MDVCGVPAGREADGEAEQVLERRRGNFSSPAERSESEHGARERRQQLHLEPAPADPERPAEPPLERPRLEERLPGEPLAGSGLPHSRRRGRRRWRCRKTGLEQSQPPERSDGIDAAVREARHRPGSLRSAATT